MIYLDHASSTPLFSELLEPLKKSYEEDFANTSAPHSLAKKALSKLEENREVIKNLLGINKMQLIFTSSATEANNLCILSFLENEGEILASMADHASIYQTVDQNFKNVIWYNREKPINTNNTDFFELVNDKTSLVALSLVNHQNGEIIDVNNLSKKIKNINANTHIHIDASQAVGKISYEFDESVVDSITFSGHKMHGPKGIAGLFFKQGILKKRLFGGGHEYGLRSSTVGLPLVVSLANTIKLCHRKQEQAYHNALELEELLVSKLSVHDLISFPFKSSVKSPYVNTIIVEKVPSDILMRHLEQRNIFVSSSSACTSKKSGVDPTFLALGLSKKIHPHILRVSFGMQTTQQEVETFCDSLIEILDELSFLY